MGQFSHRLCVPRRAGRSFVLAMNGPHDFTEGQGPMRVPVFEDWAGSGSPYRRWALCRKHRLISIGFWTTTCWPTVRSPPDRSRPKACRWKFWKTQARRGHHQGPGPELGGTSPVLSRKPGLRGCFCQVPVSRWVRHLHVYHDMQYAVKEHMAAPRRCDMRSEHLREATAVGCFQRLRRMRRDTSGGEGNQPRLPEVALVIASVTV